ncbi:hypothetical protein [uncultured Microbacterium sp.]|uniref:O-antigen ligase family protein n=1 Tax=uncultured Microbacterium sp. TaxID=191216 RepID=UPI0025EF3895|nr:hypothetical protein [uncultured Microbacterium sp.]
MIFFIAVGALAFGGVCVWALVALIQRWQMIGLYFIAAFAVIAWELPDSPSLVSIAGVQIKPEDFISITLLASALTSIRQMSRNLVRVGPFLGLFVLCLAISLASGLMHYGTQAFNEARSTIWLVAAVAWVLSRDWSQSSASLPRLFLHCGSLLCAVAVIHVVVYGWGGADSFVTAATGVLQTGRPLVSGQALVLLCCGLSLILTSGAIRVPDLLVGYVFVAVSILCMHRSIWVAAALGLLVVAVSLRGRALASTVLLAFYSGVVLMCLLASGALAAFGVTVSHALSSDGTLNAREGSWTELIDQSIQQGPQTVIFGASFGAGWGRVVNGLFIDFNPHNWYVVLYLRIGLVGLLLAAGIIGYAFIRVLRVSRVSLAVLTAICAYAWFYHLPWYIAPWLGLVLYSAHRQIVPDGRSPVRRGQRAPLGVAME